MFENKKAKIEKLDKTRGKILENVLHDIRSEFWSRHGFTTEVKAWPKQFKIENPSKIDIATDKLCITLENEIKKNEFYLNLNPYLLSINWIDLGNDEIYVLCKALENNTEIKALSLAACTFGDGGVKHILELLKKNKTIEILSIAGTNFSDKMLEEIFVELSQNKTLKVLDIGAVTEIKRKLSANSNLKFLLEFNTSLEVIYMTDFDIDFELYLDTQPLTTSYIKDGIKNEKCWVWSRHIPGVLSLSRCTKKEAKVLHNATKKRFKRLEKLHC